MHRISGALVLICQFSAVSSTNVREKTLINFYFLQTNENIKKKLCN